MPMIWKVADATNANINAAKASNSGILLGFNEPDNVNQANNTVAVRPLSVRQALLWCPVLLDSHACVCCLICCWCGTMPEL